MKSFFKKKTTVVAFALYIITTAFIFFSSLSSGSESVKQSGFVSDALSKTVEVLSGEKVILKEEGKIREYYPTSISLSGLSDTLAIGKTEILNCELLPSANYPLSKLKITSSDENVVTVNNLGVVIPKSQGVATITAVDEFSGVTATKTVTVGNAVYTPEITFGDLTGFSAEDNFVYYSPSNGASAVYAIDYTHNLHSDKLYVNVTSGEADAVLSFGKIYFYPKTTGDITFTLTATFNNISGENQTANFDYTVNVKEKFLQPYQTEFSADVTDFSIATGNTFKYQTNYSDFASGLEPSQRRIFYFTDRDSINVNLDGEELVFTPVKPSQTQFKLYYPTSEGFKNYTFNVEVTQGLPKTVNLVSSSRYAVVDKPLDFTVVGDGESFEYGDFDWSVTNGKIENGKLVASEKGKAIVTAKHKTVDGFTAQIEIKVKYSYQTYIRKIVGHFLLFFVLAIFAFVVYYRLAEVLKPNKNLPFGVVFTLCAGVFTAGLSELFQSFVANRAPAFSDVLLDFLGYVLATLILVAIYYIRKRLKRRNK